MKSVQSSSDVSLQGGGEREWGEEEIKAKESERQGEKIALTKTPDALLLAEFTLLSSCFETFPFPALGQSTSGILRVAKRFNGFSLWTKQLPRISQPSGRVGSVGTKRTVYGFVRGSRYFMFSFSQINHKEPNYWREKNIQNG